jgi:uncharacterized protein (DUF1697 family)
MLHVAFLRGINLGKSRRVGGEQLRAAFEGVGFDRVATFRASGNVIFEAGRGADLTARVETGLAQELGFDVVAFLRSAKEVRAMAGRNPFGPRQVDASTGKLQVALLPGRPGAAAREAALALASEADPLAIHGRELYWLPAARMADSELDLKALEALLGPWTMRTKGTIEQIVERHLGSG